MLIDFYNFELKVRKRNNEKFESQVTLSDFYCLIY